MEEQRKYLVYMHTCPNGKKYIGITGKSAKERWGSNGCGYVGQKHFYRAIEKYGWKNIKHEVLFEGLSKEQACNKEIELIAQYNTADKRYGYNHTYGGDINIPTEEVRKNMGLARPNRKQVRCIELNRVFETIAAAEKELNIFCFTISACCRNRQHYNTAGGYHWEYVDPKLKAKYQPNGCNKDKHNRAVRCIETGEVFDTITKAANKHNTSDSRITCCCRGQACTAADLHWEYVDEELRNKFKPKVSKFNHTTSPRQVRCIDTGIIYDSIAEAKKQTGIKNISICLIGKRITAGGYKWEYVDQSLNTPEIIAKRNRPNGKISPIRCVETGIVYNSIKEACELCNIKYKSLNCALSRKGYYKGFHWEYV